MTRLSVLAIMIVASGHVAASNTICAATLVQCGCHTSRTGTAQSFSFSIEFVGGVGTSQEQQAFTNAAESAAWEWTKRLQSRGESVDIYRVSSGGNVVVRVSAGWNSAPYNHGNGYIDFDNDEFSNSGALQYANNAHEFGHSLGFGQATGSCSLMSDWDPQNPILDFTQCDESYLNSEYTAPVDDDSDNFFANAPTYSFFYDCDDDHPGVASDCIDNDGDGYYAGVDDCDDGIYWVHENCEEYYCVVVQQAYWYNGDCYTPILIGSNAVTALTSAQEGVMFDILGDGIPRKVAWTRAGTQSGWLALDRNSNGMIDSGLELFGNATPQPPSPSPHGFKALAELDANGDEWIDARDPAYARLLLWRDANHDGVSQSEELRPIATEGLARISLRFKRSRLRDAHGNLFGLRAPILDDRNRDLGRFAWDVWLTSVPSQQ